MLNKFCDSPIHKWCAFSLAFIFLLAIVLSVPAFADDVVPSPSPTPYHMRPNDPVGWKDGDTLRDIMLVVLDSWGINFNTVGGFLLSQFDSLFNEFLEVTNQMAYEFWNDVHYGVNEIGNLVLDFTGVNAIRRFANWLIDKYSLSDESDVSVYEPVRYLPVTAYDTESVYHAGYLNHKTSYPSDNAIFNWYFSANHTGVVAVTYGFEDTSELRGCILACLDQCEYYYVNHVNFLDNRPDFNFNVGRSSISQLDLYGYFYYSNVFDPDVLDFFDSSCVGYYVDTYEDAYRLVFDLLHPTPFSITTREIDIPSEITPNDGIEITIPGTNWGDSLYSILDLIEGLIGLYDNTQLEIVAVVDTLETLMANLQHSVTVENIPGAVILDYNQYDIPLENEWGIFDIFYNTGGDEITLLRPWQELKSIIYGFPAPVLSFFALVVLFIVAYGFIRMGRDSH